jgi:hypothetical protein
MATASTQEREYTEEESEADTEYQRPVFFDGKVKICWDRTDYPSPATVIINDGLESAVHALYTLDRGLATAFCSRAYIARYDDLTGEGPVLWIFNWHLPISGQRLSASPLSTVLEVGLTAEGRAYWQAGGR